MGFYNKIKKGLKFVLTPWKSEKQSSRFRGTILLFLVLVFAVLTFQGVQHYTSKNEFCITCHEMKFSYKWYKKSIHGSNSLGISVKCVDCHLPISFMGYFKTKVIDSAKDAYKHFFHPVKTEEKWIEKKEALDEHARERIENANCMKCHKDPKPGSEEGRELHAEMDLETDKCVDCHADMFHKL